MKQKRQQVKQPTRPDGWYWLRLFIPLRGGHFHHKWEMASVTDDRVQMWRWHVSIPLTAPLLKNAAWHGPVSPPPLDEPPSTSLALEHASSHQKRKNRQAGPADCSEAGKTAQKRRLLAQGIVNAFVQTSGDLRAMYARHPEWQAELVERVAGLLEQAFGGEGARP